MVEGRDREKGAQSGGKLRTGNKNGHGFAGATKSFTERVIERGDVILKTASGTVFLRGEYLHEPRMQRSRNSHKGNRETEYPLRGADLPPVET